MDATPLQRPSRACAPPVLAVRCLTRAHLALAQRPELDALGGRMVERAATELGPLLGSPVELVVRRLEAAPRAPACLARGSVFALLELSALDAPAVLEVGKELIAALVASLAGAPAPAAPVGALTALELSAAGYLALAVLAGVRALPEAERLWGPRLHGWSEQREEAARLLGPGPLVAFQGALAVGAATGRVRLLVTARALAASVAPSAEEPAASLVGAVGAAELSAALLVGAARIDRETAGALGPGDVVVLPGLRLDARCPVGAARLRTETFVLVGELSPAGFLLHRAELRVPVEEPTMSTAAPPHLPVDVEVELTRVRLPLQHLATLRIGAVLPLHIGPGEPVLLRVGDRAVARAELVDIEGELGARVLALFD